LAALNKISSTKAIQQRSLLEPRHMIPKVRARNLRCHNAHRLNLVRIFCFWALVAMYTARFALSRHVGLTAISGRRNLAPLRREVGRWSINDGIAPRGRCRAIDRQVRSQSNIGKNVLYIKLELDIRLGIKGREGRANIP
jgi:hypothetical protein